MGMLCLSCFEKRLGRKFRKEDFVLCVLNYRDNHVVREIFSLKTEETLFKENQKL
jgi:hypothetical protein